MRILHTADWHLGHTLRGHSRQREHEHFLRWLVETAAERRIDALLIAGDVFDSANPPPSAWRLWFEFLGALKRRCPAVQVVVIAGNHDSAARLEAPRDLLAAFDVRVVGRLRRAPDGRLDTEPLLVPLSDGVGGPGALCVAIPFLRASDVAILQPRPSAAADDPRRDGAEGDLQDCAGCGDDATPGAASVSGEGKRPFVIPRPGEPLAMPEPPTSTGADAVEPEAAGAIFGAAAVGDTAGEEAAGQEATGQEATGQEATGQVAASNEATAEETAGEAADPLIVGMRALHAELFAAARAQRAPGQALVAMAHGYLVGGMLSELSERKVLGGNQHALPVDLFPEECDYVALGHLHRPQKVAARDDVRYSGSPIPLSMPERQHPHHVVFADLDDGGLDKVWSLRVPRLVPLVRLPERGELEPEAALAAVAELSARAPDGGGEDELRPLLEIAVRVREPMPSLAERLATAVADRDVRLARIEIVTSGMARDEAESRLATRDLATLQPEELFRLRYAREHDGEVPARLLEAFLELVDAVEHSEEGAP